MAKKVKETQEEPLEKKLWKAADKLRKNIDAGEYKNRIERLLAVYDWNTSAVQLNLLASHDAPRVVDIARGDKATLRLATLLQMTYPGAPCVYYGDEIGLRGTKRYDRPHRDVDARWPFPWHDPSRWDHEMLAFFREAIALRNAHPALRDGEFHQLDAHGAHYALLRKNDRETLLLMLNADEAGGKVTAQVSPHLPNGHSLVTVFGPPGSAVVADGRVQLHVAARSGVVLQA